jgi:hypothetical protein
MVVHSGGTVPNRIPKLMSLLRRPLNDWPVLVRGTLLALFVLYAAIGAVIANARQQRTTRTSHDLGFGYGVLIESIDRTGHYRVEDTHYSGVAFSAHRLPLIPYFVIGTRYLVGDNLARIAFVKIALGTLVLAVAFGRVARRCTAPAWPVLLAIGFVLAMPRWALTFFELSLEEAYLAPLFGWLFAELWFTPPVEKNQVTWAVLVGLLTTALLFVKNSTLYWCLAVPLLVWIGGQRRSAYVIFGCVAAGCIALATFNLRNAGRFTTGSSWEGWNLYKGNSVYTAGLYPPYSLDLLDYEGKVTADRPLRTEWEHNAYFKAKAIEFIRSHPAEFLNLALRKAWVFYGEVRPTGLQSRQERRYAKTGTSLQISAMIIFRVLLWTAMGLAVLDLAHCGPREHRVLSLSYLAFLFLYSGFYVVGFAYERHVMPIVLPTVWYLLRRLENSVSSLERRTGKPDHEDRAPRFIDIGAGRPGHS